MYRTNNPKHGLFPSSAENRSGKCPYPYGMITQQQLLWQKEKYTPPFMFAGQSSAAAVPHRTLRIRVPQS